ncbi:MAG: coenzyme F420-0:L-glutamate ligase [Candidatus Bipolaricaulota bacterium]|nr:coenzyme F420-0:L-glutamate ligase [Candidatus Bipolaricaulota bacterium]MDW8127253.1 coenzyme F420-0:L-glutamate ligase [Candidatus Bipolaricaulota bacterium]
MKGLPEYVGLAALALRFGPILPGTDLVTEIVAKLRDVDADGLLSDRDVVCVTEAALARAQGNFLTLSEIAAELKERFGIGEKGRLAVVFPVMSRNRFAPLLQAFAKAVRRGALILQLSHPTDPVGNPTAEISGAPKRIVTFEEIGRGAKHPITGIDYVALYRDLVEREGAKPVIFFSNDPQAIWDFSPDLVVVANIHEREETRKALVGKKVPVITLQQIACDPGRGRAWSEWGLLGSNLSAGERVKLAPRQADQFALALQQAVQSTLKKHVEVMVYGDGAFKDPTTGIYELADPVTTFGATPGLLGKLRLGFKYKFIVDQLHLQGLSAEEITAELRKLREKPVAAGGEEAEGTTPRRLVDVLATLADLLSGSADAGTPVVLVKGFL